MPCTMAMPKELKRKKKALSKKKKLKKKPKWNGSLNHISWTLQNPPSELRELKDMLELERYACFGKEIAPTTGTPHLQGYLALAKTTRFNAIQKKFTDIGLAPHIEKCKYSFAENVAYCRKAAKKPGDFWYHGTAPKQGKRTDIDEFLTDAKVLSNWDLAHKHPNAWVKYNKAGKEMRAMAMKRKGEAVRRAEFLKPGFKFNRFQTNAYIRLKQQDDRQILWIADETGGAGKSTLGRFLMHMRGAYYIRGGSNSDIACAYQKQEGNSVYCVMDLVRLQRTRVNYEIMESYKDGILFAGKYNSSLMIFEPKKLIVLANYLPDFSKLSADRWDIIHVDPNGYNPEKDEVDLEGEIMEWDQVKEVKEIEAIDLTTVEVDSDGDLGNNVDPTNMVHAIDIPDMIDPDLEELVASDSENPFDDDEDMLLLGA